MYFRPEIDQFKNGLPFDNYFLLKAGMLRFPD